MPDAHPNPLDLTHLYDLIRKAKQEPQVVMELTAALLKQAKEDADHAAESAILVAIGVSQLHLGFFDESLNLFAQAEEKSGGKKEILALVVKERLQSYINNNKYKDIGSDYLLLLKIYHSFENYSEKISALNVLAGIDYSRRKIDDAISKLNEAREIARNKEDMQSQSTISGNLASIYSSLGNFPRAIREIRSAHLNCQGDRRAVVVLQMAAIYREIGKINEALLVIDSYLEEIDNSPTVLHERFLLVNKADIIVDLHQYNDAIDIVEKRELHKSPVFKIRANALDILGKAYRGQGEIDKARLFFIESLQIFAEIGPITSQAETAINLAELELSHSSQQALHYSSLAMNLLESSKKNPKLWSRALHVSSRGYAALGEFRQAYEVGEQHRELQVRLDREAEQQRLEVAFAELEFERTQAVAEIQRTALGQARGEVAALHAHLESRVEQRTRELQAANEELSAFAWSLSHYLRTPMQLVMGHADLLVSVPEAERALHADAVVQSIGRMSDILDGLLRYAERHLKPLESRPVSVGELVGEAWTELALGDGVQLVVNPLPVVVGDPAALGLVFRNLLANAAQHSRGREGARVVVRASLEGACT
ncbi:hypothetical protein [Deinococcus aquaticus]|uniref:hypothetical protein n=1 Tax=Deinococcus aquaticus TaxID=328692 RepID=UPI003619D865